MKKEETHKVSENTFLHTSCMALKVHSGHITAECDDSWWVACMLNANKDREFPMRRGFQFYILKDYHHLCPTNKLFLQVLYNYQIEPTSPTGHSK